MKLHLGQKLGVRTQNRALNKNEHMLLCCVHKTETIINVYGIFVLQKPI